MFRQSERGSGPTASISGGITPFTIHGASGIRRSQSDTVGILRQSSRTCRSPINRTGTRRPSALTISCSKTDCASNIPPLSRRRSSPVRREGFVGLGRIEPMPRIMTDRGTEYCGRVDGHDFRPFLAVNDTDHTKTRVKSPRTDGIRGRFHKTVLQGFHQVAFRKKPYDGIGALRADPDEWLNHYSRERGPSGRNVLRRNPVPDHDRGQGDPEGKVPEPNLT